jgi:hypothetical protein
MKERRGEPKIVRVVTRKKKKKRLGKGWVGNTYVEWRERTVMRPGIDLA